MAEDIVVRCRLRAENKERFHGAVGRMDAKAFREAADTIETLRRELAEANARTERVRPCD